MKKDENVKDGMKAVKKYIFNKKESKDETTKNLQEGKNETEDKM